MALEHCASCTAAYAVGLVACPQCRTPKEGLVKITQAGVSVGPDDFRPRVAAAEALAAAGHDPADAARVTGAAGEVFQVDDGGIAGAEGLEVLKVPAEGADVPAGDAAPPPEPAKPPAPRLRPPRVTGSGGVTLPKTGAGNDE